MQVLCNHVLYLPRLTGLGCNREGCHRRHLEYNIVFDDSMSDIGGQLLDFVSVISGIGCLNSWQSLNYPPFFFPSQL